MKPIIIKIERTDLDVDNSAIEIQTPETRVDECGNEYVFWTKEVIRTVELEDMKQKEIDSKASFIQECDARVAKFDSVISMSSDKSDTESLKQGAINEQVEELKSTLEPTLHTQIVQPVEDALLDEIEFTISE